MKKCFLIVLCLLSLWLPGQVSADCMNIYFDSFYIQQDGTVILYSGQTPIAKLTLDCTINADSRIRLLKSYVCGGDDILVDGSPCKIISVTSP